MPVVRRMPDAAAQRDKKRLAIGVQPIPAQRRLPAGDMTRPRRLGSPKIARKAIRNKVLTRAFGSSAKPFCTKLLPIWLKP